MWLLLYRISFCMVNSFIVSFSFSDTGCLVAVITLCNWWLLGLGVWIQAMISVSVRDKGGRGYQTRPEHWSSGKLMANSVNRAPRHFQELNQICGCSIGVIGYSWAGDRPWGGASWSTLSILGVRFLVLTHPRRCLKIENMCVKNRLSARGAAAGYRQLVGLVLGIAHRWKRIEFEF